MQYTLTRAGQWFIVRRLATLLKEKYDHDYKFNQYVSHFINTVEDEACEEWGQDGSPENGHAWVEVPQSDTWNGRPAVIGVPSHFFEASI